MKNIQRARRAAKSSARPLMASIFLLPPLPTHTHANEHALSIRGNNDKEESYSAGLISFQAHSHISPLPTWRIECTHLHLHERVHSLTFAAKKGGGMKRGQKKMDRKCVFLCGFFALQMQPWMAMQQGEGKKERKQQTWREAERGDTGERENQPALTLRQSISSLLSLFPMGWPG